MSAGRGCAAGFLIGALLLGHSSAAEPLQIDEAQLFARFEAYRNGPEPIVYEMNGGLPLLLVYASGEVIFRDDTAPPQSPLERKTSGFVHTHLSAAELGAFLQRVTAISGFWDLQSSYELIKNMSDQPIHLIRVRLPNRPEQSVRVYGTMDAKIRENAKGSRSPYTEPPPALSEMDELLRNFKPENAKPWDPGFVEITMSDVGHTRTATAWPAGWPGLESPLIRVGTPGTVLKHVMVVPSERIAEVQTFLAGEGRGGVQFGAERLYLGIRWPFPGERKWPALRF